MAATIFYSRRVRPTPFTSKVETMGVSTYSVYNRMLLPMRYQLSVEETYWHLREHVQIWDVSCERQVEILGADAAILVQMITPRDLSKARVGRCYYAPVTDQHAGMLNDPMILKLAEDRFWLSIADSDLLYYVKGLAIGLGLRVDIFEPDVSPLAIQGPKADDLMAAVFGPSIRELKFFGFTTIEFQGRQMIVSRSGYSSQGGFEIYLNDSALGPALWDALWQAGEPLNIAPGAPHLTDRIEGGLLSYGNDIRIENNPLEVGLGQYCHQDRDIDFIGKKALRKIAAKGPSKILRGFRHEGKNVPTCTGTWPVTHGNRRIGQLTSTAWSPRLKTNVSLVQINAEHAFSGDELKVACEDGRCFAGELCDLPFDNGKLEH